jgi:hypothetical protein
VRGPRFAGMDYSPLSDYAALGLATMIVILLVI